MDHNIVERTSRLVRVRLHRGVEVYGRNNYPDADRISCLKIVRVIINEALRLQRFYSYRHVGSETWKALNSCRHSTCFSNTCNPPWSFFVGKQ
ncbi:hypothetical protein SUGI_0667950 [Cryptomeria japonica]|nr:hypothetical protein SUGI_0667950 [Cryptomeria japonica]